MRDWNGKTYWLVGASEGIGRALAHRLSKVGTRLILSARNAERLEGLARELPGPARVLPLDVTDAESLAGAAPEGAKADGIVHLAGAYWPLSARDWDAEKIETMLQVNLVGAARVMGRVVPDWRARGHGHIVLIGSLAAHRGLQNTLGYGASKAGLKSLAQSMRAGLRHSGVEVQLANPGYVRTRMTDRNSFRMPQLMEPEDAARQIFEHMNSDRFERNFPLGLAAALTMGRALPKGLWFGLTGARRPRGGGNAKGGHGASH